MREKAMERLEEQVKPHLGDGEHLKEAVNGLEGPMLAAYAGVLGMMFMKVRVVAVTDRNVYVLTMGKGTGRKVTEVVDTRPVPAPVEFKKGTPLGKLTVGDRTILISRILANQAEKVAAAARGASE